ASPVFKDVKITGDRSMNLEQSSRVNGNTWKRGLVHDQFENLLIKLTGAVKEMQDRIFRKLGDLLDTKEFNNGIAQLRQLLVLINLNNYEIQETAENKKMVENAIKNVTEIFQQLLEQSWANIENGSKSKVNAVEFEKAVMKLREIEQKIHHK
ncbi:hypothetical protein QAD02_016025, partial [Eretmocerus hayati]